MGRIGLRKPKSWAENPFTALSIQGDLCVADSSIAVYAETDE